MNQVVYVSRCQKRVHDTLWRLTERGRKDFLGALYVPDMDEGARVQAAKRLATLGLIEVSVVPGVRGRRYAVKAPPEILVVRGASRREPVCDAKPIRDTGKFMAAVRRLKLPPFDAPQGRGAA